MARQQPDRPWDSSLPAAEGQPAAGDASLQSAGPVRPHEVFGFAPYWTLPAAAGFNLSRLSTIAYFGVDIGPDGSVIQSGGGWNGYQSQQLSDLVTRAHHGGVRVVLTAKSFDGPTLHRLARDRDVQARFATAIIDAADLKRLDGVNLDFEGTGSVDRTQFAEFVRGFASIAHEHNPHWQITVDTYGGSAGASEGWFDVAAMAPAVDAFFVMAYDMYRDGRASPNAPLGGQGPADEELMQAYASVAGRQKVILGTPFYGYDWATVDSVPGSASSSPPMPLSYAQILAAGHPRYWDDAAKVPWTAYRDRAGWRETYFDDPRSLALKAGLAERLGLLGVGVWALGMEGDDQSLLAALAGAAGALRPGYNPWRAPEQQPGGGAKGVAGGEPPGAGQDAGAIPTPVASENSASPSPSPSPPSPSPSPRPSPSPTPSPRPSPSPTPPPCLLIC